MREIVRYTLLAAFVVIFLAPLLLLISAALRSSFDVGSHPVSLPTSGSFHNFRLAWVGGQFQRYFVNSVIYTAATLAGVLTLGSLAGYGLARYKFRGRGVLTVVIMLGLIVPLQSIMIPLYYLLIDLHLAGTRAAMIVSGTALGLPIATFLMRSFFASLPEELAEAARLDGCGEAAVFFRVMLPLAVPGLSTVAVVQFLATWNTLLLPLITVPNNNLRPLSFSLVLFQGRYSSDFALIAAATVITILPVVAFFIAVQRQFIRGVTAGAIGG